MRKPFSKIIKQPNLYTCLPASLAMVLGLELKEVFKLFGHDGSKVINPNKDYPFNLEAFMTDQVPQICAALGYIYMDVKALVAQKLENGEEFLTTTNPRIWNKDRFFKFIWGKTGILTVNSKLFPDKQHAVAWDGFEVYDPHSEENKPKKINEYTISSFAWIHRLRDSAALSEYAKDRWYILGSLNY